MAEMKRYAADNLGFAKIAAGMETQWTIGMRQSLGVGDGAALDDG